ncbi:sigma-70 family RNA polymerase sigma factor [Luteococcus peritonei]|uniref:Sigma-70 family RNA polymerase sigma factor n=1 Tax=Luteococcus peritonei TaxID=88874 RepID=A0ABW4RWB2_9ACTN
MTMITTNRDLPELLSHDEECHLAAWIEAGVLARAALDEGGTGAPAEELEALARAGEAAWHRFLEANVRLVAQMARRAAAGRDIDPDELFQEGMVALAEALRRWDHRRGLRFSTYATPWVRNALTLHLARRGGRVEGPTHRPRMARRLREDRARLEAELGRHLSDAEFAHRVGQQTERVQLLLASGVHRSLEELDFEPVAAERPEDLLERSEPWWLGELPRHEADLLRWRYGVHDGQPRTHAEVARLVGVSPATAARMERRALLSARRLIEGAGERAA